MPVQFGDVRVPKRRYRLTLGADSFALADINTMVLIATIPVEETTMVEIVTPAKVEIKQKGSTVEIVLRYADKQYRAVGSTAERAVPDASLVTLAGRKERTVERADPAAATDAANVRRALRRYLRSVNHCADAAHRSRWRTDDPRFIRCVCPIVAKWRLPKVKKRLRVNQPLAKGRSGFSFSVIADGSTDACSVWTGAVPPPPPKAESAAPKTPAAADAVLEPTPLKMPAAADAGGAGVEPAPNSMKQSEPTEPSEVP
ncbi:MAG: hypothetical protein V3T05_00985 [Myxococcota bacterium]